MINYIFYTTVGLGSAYLLYHLLLRSEKSLHFNRFYLLGSLLLCLAAPLLEIDFGFSGAVTTKPDLDQLIGGTTAFLKEDVRVQSTEIIEKNTSVIPQILLLAYLLVTAILLFRFFRNLHQIHLMVKGKTFIEVDGMQIISIEKAQDPFSFFHYLFINEKDLGNSSYFTSVLAHETAHSRQYHSADILLLEFLNCFFWFNPFLKPLRKAILSNHEYLADAAVIDAGVEVEAYSQQLIQAGNRIQSFGLGSGFSFIQTKNRLNMLHITRSKKAVRAAKILSVLTLFSLVFAFSSFTHRNTEPFKVIVDAGHGGTDPGNQNEKEINLQIALALKALSDEQEVEIVLIRDSDVSLALKERAAFFKSQDADMMLSLHCNAAPGHPEAYGIQAFVSKQSKEYEKSYRYSKLLLAEQLGEFTDKAEIKTANFLLLRDQQIPAILLELGYLTNPQEGARLEDPAFQKEIAANLYQGLLKIKAQR